jgi:hypothetical protein
MAKYFVEVNGKNLGPYEIDELIAKVSSKEVPETSRLFDPQLSDWISVKDFVGIHLANSKKQAAPVAQKTAPASTPVESSGEDEWFVLKGENRYGPYTKLDLIRLVQEKNLFNFDFIWRKGMDSWLRMAELPEFSHDQIRKLILDETNRNVIDVFAKRKHKRISYECDVVAHDNTALWKGQCVELSEGGAGVVFENSLLLPGHKIYLHFLPGSMSKPFNVLSEVVSKKYSQAIKKSDTVVVYGIRFINLQKTDYEQIKVLTAA